MESLEETDWDLVLVGTGLLQSLLALALSRSGKKILHVDRNDYYGGTEAALSLQEIEAWVEKVNDATRPSSFRNAILQKEEQNPDSTSALGFPRAYSISLSPQLIYTRSNLLPTLVSSKVHPQLDFLAVGSWWIYSQPEASSNGNSDSVQETSIGSLKRIPGGREDVFSDKSIDLRSSRSLMKFLKLAADTENHPSVLEAWGSKPFPEYLTSEHKIPAPLQAPLLALTSSPHPPSQTLTSFALPRIHQHLTSIGLFGPGFGAVLPKWGGLSEIAQVGCRAGAVGGGVYVLNNGVETTETVQPTGKKEAEKPNASPPLLKLRLGGGEDIKTHFVIGAGEDLPQQTQNTLETDTIQVSQSISIVSSALPSLFYLAAEGAPPPAATVVVFPTGSLSLDDVLPSDDVPPVYLTIHSSDTGECPAGQSIIYAQTSLPQPHASTLLTLAAQTLLQSLPSSTEPTPSIFWTLQYTRFQRLLNPLPQRDSVNAKENKSSASSNPSPDTTTSNTPINQDKDAQVITLPSPPPGLALDDSVLKSVREVWAKIHGGDDGTFMLFEERGDLGEAEDDEAGKSDDDEGQSDDDEGQISPGGLQEKDMDLGVKEAADSDAADDVSPAKEV